MYDHATTYVPKLFYSYSHKDDKCRERMETSLALLTRNGILATWSDHEILPGRDIPEAIIEQINNADIVVFLFSNRFIASQECMKEWNRAQVLSEQGSLHFRVPIILTPCAWEEILSEDSVKALPNDGKSISSFRDKDAAWQQVYHGIKQVIESIKNATSPRDAFARTISRTDFIFGNTAMLPDVYVFPTLLHHRLKPTAKSEFRDRTIDQDHLMERDYTVVYGDDVSGKTALLRYLFLTLSQNPRKQVRPLLIDLKNVSGQSNDQRGFSL